MRIYEKLAVTQAYGWQLGGAFSMHHAETQSGKSSFHYNQANALSMWEEI
jgi:hypothetical protein